MIQITGTRKGGCDNSDDGAEWAQAVQIAESDLLSPAGYRISFGIPEPLSAVARDLRPYNVDV